MKAGQSIARDVARLVVWYPIRWLVRVIPASASFSLFKMMGSLHHALAKRKRRLISREMRRLLGQGAGSRSVVKAYFENHYLDRLHIFLYARPSIAEDFAGRVIFENLELLDSLLEAGRGVLVVQPHFGPVQITLLSLALRGYEPMQIGYPDASGLSLIGRKVAFRYRMKYEAMLPAPILVADKYLGAAFKHLKKPGVALTTGDGAGGGLAFGEQRSFSFLGVNRPFPLGPAVWAIRIGAAFLPAFIVPETTGKFRVIFERPIEPGSNETDEAKRAMTAEFIALLEKHVKLRPDCWHFWDELS